MAVHLVATRIWLLAQAVFDASGYSGILLSNVRDAWYRQVCGNQADGIHQDHAGLGLASALKLSGDCAIAVPAIRQRAADAYEPVYNDLSALSHNPASVTASSVHTSAGMRKGPCL